MCYDLRVSAQTDFQRRGTWPSCHGPSIQCWCLGHFAYHLVEFHQHNHEMSSYQHRPGLRLSVPIIICLMIYQKIDLKETLMVVVAIF